MKQFIKDFFNFLSISRSYTGYGYMRMIFKEKGLLRAYWFCRQVKFDREMIRKHGAENYYMMQDRTLEL